MKLTIHSRHASSIVWAEGSPKRSKGPLMVPSRTLTAEGASSGSSDLRPATPIRPGEPRSLAGRRRPTVYAS